MKKQITSTGAILTEVSRISGHQLLENHRLIEALLEHFSDGVVIVRAGDGEPVISNRAARNFYESFYGLCIADDGVFVAPEQTPAARALRGEVIREQKYFLYRQDGVRHRLLVNASPVFEEGDGATGETRGAVVAAIVTFRDTSEPARTEGAPEAGEGRYRELVENANDIIYTHDFEGRITSFNRAATRLLGYTEADMPLHISDIIIPEERDRAYAMMARRLAGEETSSYELEVVSKTGATFVLEVNPRLMLAAGRPAGVQGVARDITERKHREKEARALQDRFVKAFNASPHPMAILSLESGRFLDLNDRACQQTGYSREEVIGRTPLETRFFASEEAYAAFTRTFFEEGAIRDVELEFSVKSGDKRWGLFSVQRIEVDGEACVLISQIDITERRQKEAELKASEKRFSTIFNSNPLPMALNTLKDGRFLDVNESWTKESGFSRAEVLGRTEDELGTINPEDLKRLRALLRKNRSLKNIEMRLRSKSGEAHTGLFFTEPVEVNQQMCLLTTTLDITERKRQEEQLLLSQREWRTTFDAIPDAIVLIDPDDRLVRANKAFYEKVQLTEETALGRTVKEVIHQDANFLSADVCPLCQLREERKAGTLELPPGVVTNYPLFASIVPLFDGGGEFLGTLQVIRDLSALYLAREEAEQERVSLNATLEQMAEGLMIFDEQGRVLRANSSAQQIFGYTLEEMRGDRGSVMMDGQYTDKQGRELPAVEHPIQVALREQRTVGSHVVLYTHPDGERASLSLTASPFFNEHGRLAGAVAIVRDVTQQQKEQERLLQADKLRALGQLASGVAHNFNNALAAIMGYSQLALRKTSDPELQKYLRIVEQSSKDAARMVERIQNFSRTRSKKDEFVSVRIVDIVRDAIDITRPRWRNDAEAVGIKYAVALDWSVPDNLCVNGESSELREVFVNIILNSLDAMPRGGKIAISAATTKNQIKIVFKDVGVGMTEEVKSRIFEPFFTTKGASGLGLGLSESYRIVERHKGHLDVESEPERGTTFTITLPILVLKSARARRPSGEYALPKKRFLVIDDEEVVRYAFALVLEDLGHDVAKAANAQEALELVKRGGFDMVFTDLAMPDVDGIATAKQIRALLPNAKIVLMSGYSFDKVQERAKETRCLDATMSKPFNIPELQKLIQRLLGGQ